MSDTNEVISKLNEIQEKIDSIESDIEEIKNKSKLREKPLNFWEFLLEVNWCSVIGFVFISIILLKKLVK